MSVFDVLGVPGKLTMPSFLKLWTCGKSSLGSEIRSREQRLPECFSDVGGLFSDRGSGLTREKLGDPRVAHRV
jgi:hypothetical protein